MAQSKTDNQAECTARYAFPCFNYFLFLFAYFNQYDLELYTHAALELVLRCHLGPRTRKIEI